MGLTASKVCKKVPREDLQEGSIPSTPILAPKVVKHDENLELDPRSPSVLFSRTPLQLLSAATLKLNELNEDVDSTPVKSKVILLGIDPRSPTVEFNRTPIIVNVSESDASEKIHNKHLDRVKRSVIITTPKSTPKKEDCEKILATVPPKLLESSPIRTKPDASKRKSFVGLLETNIDFTETDLDAVIREKNKVKEISITSTERTTLGHKQISKLIQLENDPRSPTNDFIRTPIQTAKKMPDLDLNNENDFECGSRCIEDITPKNLVVELQDHNIVEKCVQETCESIHLKTKMESDEIKSNASTVMNDLHDDKLDEVEAIEDDSTVESVDTEVPRETKSAPITPPVTDGNAKSVVAAITKEIKSAPVTPPVVNLMADVKEFDKKLTSLIYQDEDIVICPRKVKLKDYDSRSPLRNINSNEPEKIKLSQKKLMKSEFAVSKIPVFREKCKKTETQCENTPPRNMEKRKVKVRKSHWDNADQTLII